MSFSKTIALSCLLSSSMAISLVHAEDSSTGKAQSVFAEMENPERKRMDQYRLDYTVHCAPIRNDQRKLELYQVMSSYKWDRGAMGCALEYGTEIVNDSWLSYFDVEEKLKLLGARTEYFDVLNKQYNAHYQGGDLTTELSWRWVNNRREGEKLIEELNLFDPFVPAVQLVGTAFQLASNLRETPTEESLASIHQAKVDLEQVVESNPEALDGLGLLMLGQLLMSLPEFSGGDVLKATELFQEGRKVAPNNMHFQRWLIEAYVAEREDELAVEVLEQANNIAVEDVHPQDYVDFAKEFGGVASRMGRKDLAISFQEKRTRLLKSKNYLLERKERASVGHGGENPITGKLTN